MANDGQSPHGSPEERLGAFLRKLELGTADVHRPEMSSDEFLRVNARLMTRPDQVLRYLPDLIAGLGLLAVGPWGMASKVAAETLLTAEGRVAG